MASIGCPCCAFTLSEKHFLPPNVVLNSETQISEDTECISPTIALHRLQTRNVPIIDTHCHAHLDQGNVVDTSQYAPHKLYGEFDDNQMVVVSCAVSPSDWQGCLEYASQSKFRRAALGVHPWYIDQLLDDNNELEFTWLQDLEALLQRHPCILVGEIGLCKHAKFVRTFSGGKTQALELQRIVLKRQLELAAQYQRPVSVHCVDQQGVMLQIFNDLTASSRKHDDCLPSAIALHSFTGTAHHVQQLLHWESSLHRKATHPLLYFGFSHNINYCGSSSEKSRRQGAKAIRSVPSERLLAESDVHIQRHVAAGTSGAIAYLTWALRPEQGDGTEGVCHDEVAPITLESVAQLTTRNAIRFLHQSC